MNARVEIGPAQGGVAGWQAANQRWLVDALGQLRVRAEQAAAAPEAWATAARAPIAAFAPAPGFSSALQRCALRVGLSAFEAELLLLAAGVELDQRLGSAIAALGGAGGRPSFGLAMGLLTDPHWDAVSNAAALRHWHLIEPVAGHSLAQAPLCVPERVLHFIAGVPACEPRLQGLMRVVGPDTGGAPQPAHDGARDALVRQVAAALVQRDADAPLVTLDTEDRSVDARAELNRIVLRAVGARAALWIAARELPSDVGGCALIARLVDREVALTDAVPVLVFDEAPAASAAGFIAQLRSALIVVGAPASAFAGDPQPRRVQRFTVPRAEAAQARAALLGRWRQRRAEASADDDPPNAMRSGTDVEVEAALDRAARQFELGATVLDAIALRLATLPPADRPGAVWAAARAATRGGLDALAARVATRVSFDDLVLPPAPLAALREIARQLRQRDRVHGEWGFGAMHARGQGTCALFAGDSGTGKTLAAEAIANEVGLDLYRVDLASMVSKYIGETEKNLKHLFDAAQASGAVLLFDEADALFGKRSEVKDSHDRHANIEVAYLLQRIECYRGVAVLTTNMKSTLDRAFLRRIRFVVTFPFPDAAAREQIWRRQFPPAAPLGRIDFAALAQLDLAGGTIRNIALNAAFKAADSGVPIDQGLLLEAARAEYTKLDRQPPDGCRGGAR